jgi:hypothetical protein
MLAERGCGQCGGSVSRVVRVDVTSLCSGKYNRKDIYCTVYCKVYCKVYCTARILSSTGGIYPLHRNDTVVEGVGDIQSSI